ncbi:flagellar motor protein MotB [Lichenicoccus roseus]|uniref:Flagellar motor protein MotB n=1 Tax=Lichenicoccus roseus TaxID=2683649 RepID=A0A5R9J3J7_9PROT|nr:flagellar motor protein MotB [Lichenicoccus roseus]TLU72194.1 flagellar motor protein MotB [Lichenicoccus roseus]
MAGGRSNGKNAARGGGNVIIRREEIVEGGHHGGAWKVAYADFVTAMMAFFLLMWLINATTQDQRRGIAAYFSPMAKVENGFSGTGMVPGGASPVADGAQLIDQGPPQLATLSAHADKQTPENDGDPDTGTASEAKPGPLGVGPNATYVSAPPSPAGPPPGAKDSKLATSTASGKAVAGSDGPPGGLAKGDTGSRTTLDAGQGDGQAAAQAEAATLHDAAEAMRAAVANDASLRAFAGQMSVDVTPEGLRIQIMDSERQPMFATGSMVPNERAQQLLRLVAPFIAKLPQMVSIGGYTDAGVYRAGQVSNWSLSSGRADAARNVLVGGGLSESRLSNVTGYADHGLLLPADPLSPSNRRIVLTLQRILPAPGVAAAARDGAGTDAAAAR